MVTLLFTFSWMPIHAIHLAFKFFEDDFPIWSRGLYAFKAVAHTLTYTNSMLNPFFYTIIGNNFRKKIQFCRKKERTRRFSNVYFTRLNNNNQESFSLANRKITSPFVNSKKHSEINSVVFC